MTKDNQTTISYGDEIAEWVEQYTEERECSKGAAIRYCIKQQMQRGDVTEHRQAGAEPKTNDAGEIEDTLE